MEPFNECWSNYAPEKSIAGTWKLTCGRGDVFWIIFRFHANFRLVKQRGFTYQNLPFFPKSSTSLQFFVGLNGTFGPLWPLPFSGGLVAPFHFALWTFQLNFFSWVSLTCSDTEVQTCRNPSLSKVAYKQRKTILQPWEDFFNRTPNKTNAQT